MPAPIRNTTDENSMRFYFPAPEPFCIYNVCRRFLARALNDLAPLFSGRPFSLVANVQSDAISLGFLVHTLDLPSEKFVFFVLRNFRPIIFLYLILMIVKTVMVIEERKSIAFTVYDSKNNTLILDGVYFSFFFQTNLEV